MGEIFLHSFGNGTAYASNYYPNDGDRVILTSVPNTGASLDDIQAFDQNGHSIALAVREQLVFRYRAAYGAMTINVYFSGGPTPPPYSRFPYWLLFKIRDGNKLWQLNLIVQNLLKQLHLLSLRLLSLKSLGHQQPRSLSVLRKI